MYYNNNKKVCTDERRQQTKTHEANYIKSIAERIINDDYPMRPTESMSVVVAEITSNTSLKIIEECIG